MKLLKTPLALILTLALLGALAGCGGGSSSTLSTASSTATAQKGQAQKNTKQAKAEGSAPTPSAPLPNEGSSDTAPGVPTSKSGDNTIQTFGTEASAGQRVAAARLVASYLRDQAAGRWEAACGELRSLIRSKLTQLAKSDHASTGKGCGAGMHVVLARIPKSARGNGPIDVLSFRVRGPVSFVIYRNAAGKPYYMQLRREGGQWRIGVLNGVPLAP